MEMTRLAAVAALLLALGAEARVGGPLRDIRTLIKKQNEASKPKDTSCTCLPWSQVYNDEKVECGSGMEDSMGEKKKNELCEGLFTKLNNNYCVNLDTHRHSEQWCYVSSKCGRLHDGEHLPGTGVSWKTCGTADPRSREMSVEALKVLSKSENLDLSLVLKMAYPVHRPAKHHKETQQWQFVQRAWGVMPGGYEVANFVAGKADKFLAQDDLQAMEDVKETGQPTIILNGKNNLGKSYPFGVVQGNRVYEVNLNQHADLWQPHQWKTIMCRTGCSPWGW